jgi:membrane protease YdiL (CAAX protease family)
LSFAVGGFEETIFRGWIFGSVAGRSGSWLVPAAWTSAVFAGVHLYYGATYQVASLVIFPTLFLMGFAFAATYRFSGGNLLVPALLHGVHDASAYLALVNAEVGDGLEYSIIIVGAIVALIAALRDDTPGLPSIPSPPTAPP